jgi:hypothetical protein
LQQSTWDTSLTSEQDEDAIRVADLHTISANRAASGHWFTSAGFLDDGVQVTAFSRLNPSCISNLLKQSTWDTSLTSEQDEDAVRVADLHSFSAD